MIMARLDELRRSADQEVIWRDNFGRDGTHYVLKLCGGAPGLYCRQYGKGRNSVICVSKVPLPDYRADLDERFGKQQANVAMSSDGQAKVRSLLERTELAAAAAQQQRPQSAPVSSAATASAEARAQRQQQMAAEQTEEELEQPEQPEEVADAWDDSSSDDDQAPNGSSGIAQSAQELESTPETASKPSEPEKSSKSVYVPPGRRQAEPERDAQPAAPNKAQQQQQQQQQQQRQQQTDTSAQMLTDLEAKRSQPEFRRMLEFRQQLPSYSQRAELIAALNSSQVLVVSGETGCGKTTQVRPRCRMLYQCNFDRTHCVLDLVGHTIVRRFRYRNFCLTMLLSVGRAPSATSFARSRGGSRPSPWQSASPPSAARPSAKVLVTRSGSSRSALQRLGCYSARQAYCCGSL
jgi:hypothetical protein